MFLALIGDIVLGHEFEMTAAMTLAVNFLISCSDIKRRAAIRSTTTTKNE